MHSDNKQVTTLLKEREERRFEEFFGKFARTGNNMQFTEFIMFLIDRSLIQNKHTLLLFLKYFDDAVNGGERQLNKQQFSFLLSQISQHIFHNDQHHLDKLLAEILSDKTTVSKEQSIEVTRQIIYDEINKRILTEPALKIICSYESEFKGIFTIYMQENQQKGYIMLKWKEIAIQNKRMSSPALVRFLRDAEIVPHILSIEQFEECMMKVVPPVNNREFEFYQKSHLVHIYERNSLDSVDGDPHISLHELQLVLSRIAYDIGAREEGVGHNKRFDVEKHLRRFFSELMFLRTNDQIDAPLPNLNRKLIKNLEKYAGNVDKEDEVFNQDELSSDEGDAIDPIQQIAEMQQSLIFNAPNAMEHMHLDQIIKMLDKELPPIPPRQEVKKEQWDPEKRVTIGLPKPVSPSNKNAKPKPNKPKQQQRKQGEVPPRKIIFEERKPDYKTSEQYIEELSDKLKFDEKMLSDMERGSLSKIQVAPVLIAEVLYPPNPPPSAQTYIEAAINSHNESNYILAIQNYDEGRKAWAQHLGRELPEGLELYFEFSKGQVYESAGRDDLALQSYLQARLFSAKLPTNNPDKALIYCGLGSVMFGTEEYEWALRSFLKAREYREIVIGIETVDTATVFNNLGCCMYMLDRNKEAYAYFKLAHAVLDSELGALHPRTLTAARNISKANNNWYDNQPEFKNPWVAYVQDPFQAGGKKKKKKGKK